MEIKDCLERLRDISRSAKQGPCDKCKAEDDFPDCVSCIEETMTTAADFIEKHLPSEPLTAADAIRAASDKELADFLAELLYSTMNKMCILFDFSNFAEVTTKEKIRDIELAILHAPAKECV